MDSLRYLASWVLRHRFTLAFCAAVIGPVLVGGFSDQRGPSPFRTRVMMLAGCPNTGCECLDDCLNEVYGSGGEGQIGSTPIHIERNLGQTDGRYPFVAQGSRHSIRLSATEAVFDFPGSKRARARTVRATVVGADASVQGQEQEPMSGRVNYFRGNDPKLWVTDIPTFGRVTFPGIYPGIDLSYHGSGGYLENDFIVQPGGDADRILIRFDGADDVRVETDGSLTIALDRRGLSWKKPVVLSDHGDWTEEAGGRTFPERFERSNRFRNRRLRFDPAAGDRSRDHLRHLPRDSQCRWRRARGHRCFRQRLHYRRHGQPHLSDHGRHVFSLGRRRPGRRRDRRQAERRRQADDLYYASGRRGIPTGAWGSLWTPRETSISRA